MSDRAVPGQHVPEQRVPNRGYRVPRCGRCGVATNACFCAEIVPLANLTQVVFCMHRLELSKSSNSVRLMQCALTRAECIVLGERAAPPEYPELARPLLLFPSSSARFLDPSDRGRPLLVPDGSWSQARKIAHKLMTRYDAEIVQIPARISTYGLREARNDGTVSTFEAVSEALHVLEGDALVEPLAALFQRFVAASFQTRGRRSSFWMNR